uniref:ABM domain-containing protein n=1 Tax=Entomoneis paludosa TaxID=265537 RepID=A0A7S2YJ68_9STRA|mmetsp:Transcript_35356/g.73612  ORF Transcript_35356/g.73612 Transcript_35356/m.73612 type:complete len:255 (+) Transcript_35356:91-855(+)
MVRVLSLGCMFQFLVDLAWSFSASPSTSSLLALNAKLVVRPDQQEAWLHEIGLDQICTRRDEPGNLQFMVGQDTTDSNIFYLHEEFVNSQAFEAHTQTPHFARYKDFCDKHDVFEQEPELLFYQIMGESEELKEKRSVGTEPTFGLNVNLYPKPEIREAFLEVIQNNKQGTDTTEPLALQYTYGESTTKPNVFYFHEQYVGDNHGKQGFDAHAQTDHFAAWEDFVTTDPFVQPPEIGFYHICEPSSSTVVAAKE